MNSSATQWYVDRVREPATRRCLRCGAPLVWVESVGWVDAVPGKTYDLCDADPFGKRATLVATGTKTYSIQFAKTGKTIDCPEDTPILTAAKAAGMRLPSSCTKGMCGTCKSRKLSGEVEMTHQGGIRQREIDAGLFLPCCSRPLSDLVIER